MSKIDPELQKIMKTWHSEDLCIVIILKTKNWQTKKKKSLLDKSMAKKA